MSFSYPLNSKIILTSKSEIIYSEAEENWVPSKAETVAKDFLTGKREMSINRKNDQRLRKTQPNPNLKYDPKTYETQYKERIYQLATQALEQIESSGSHDKKEFAEFIHQSINGLFENKEAKVINTLRILKKTKQEVLL